MEISLVSAEPNTAIWCRWSNCWEVPTEHWRLLLSGGHARRSWECKERERKPTKMEIKPLCGYIVVYVYICISTPGALEQPSGLGLHFVFCNGTSGPCTDLETPMSPAHPLVIAKAKTHQQIQHKPHHSSPRLYISPLPDWDG